RLVRDLLVVHPLQLARPLLDRALDVVLGHRGVLRGVDRRAESRVTGRIATPLLGGDRDFPNELGEQRTALRIGRGLVVLDLFPLAMTSHVTKSAAGVRMDVRRR